MRHGSPARKFDLSPAEKFGELVFILSWNDTAAIAQNVDSVVSKIGQRLQAQGFDPGDDYVLLTGDWVAMAATVAIALELGDWKSPVNCLQWDREARRYEVVPLDLRAVTWWGDEEEE